MTNKPTMETFILSDENYYSNEADLHYMSVSQYKSFLKCEAAQMAKLRGEWQPNMDAKALLVGNYVHSYFESKKSHEKFIDENKDKMYSSRKPFSLLKDFQVAEQMIARLNQEPMFKSIYQGVKEPIVTGKLFGVLWKGKIDCLNLEDDYFVDLKTSKDIHERKWDERYSERATFIERFGYVLQMAVYKELLKQQYGKEFLPSVVAVSKQTPSEASLISIDETKMEFELMELEENIEHIMQVKSGKVEAHGCGQCDYCRGHQRINGFISMNDL